MIKNILKIKMVIIMIAGLVLLSPVSVFAYTLLEPLPGLGKEVKGLADYLGWLFPFALTVAAILAVIMIVIGGLELAGGGNEGLKTSGKKKIEGAIYGLLLAVSAFLILHTINPDLVNMSLSIGSATLKENAQTDKLNADSNLKFCNVVFRNIALDTVERVFGNSCVDLSDCTGFIDKYGIIVKNEVKNKKKASIEILGADCISKN